MLLNGIASVVLAGIVAACGGAAREGFESEARGDRDPAVDESGPRGSTPPPGNDAPAQVTAAAILAKLGTCTKVSTAPYATDTSKTANVDVCGLKNAVFWTADMDIDCDGKSSPECNPSTDPYFQAATAATDSTGAPLDPAKLPFIVVPGVSERWSYKASGIAMGSVAAVIYQGKIQFGIVGDIGPAAIIGEASHAMAKKLGIDPHPSTGGTSGGVTYVVFTGPSAVVKVREDHAEAVSVGSERAADLLAEN